MTLNLDEIEARANAWAEEHYLDRSDAWVSDTTAYLIQAVRERDEIIKAAIMHLRKLRILTKELNMDSSFCDVDDWFIEYEDQIEKWGLK